MATELGNWSNNHHSTKFPYVLIHLCDSTLFNIVSKSTELVNLSILNIYRLIFLFNVKNINS